MRATCSDLIAQAENIAELQAAWNSFSFADGLHDKNAVDGAVYRILAAERAIAAPGMEARMVKK